MKIVLESEEDIESICKNKECALKLLKKEQTEQGEHTGRECPNYNQEIERIFQEELNNSNESVRVKLTIKKTYTLKQKEEWLDKNNQDWRERIAKR